MRHLILFLSLICFSVSGVAQLATVAQSGLYYRVPLQNNAVLSVENPVAVSVTHGTSFSTGLFQPTVRAVMQSGNTKDIPVTFAVGSYDGNTDGMYTLTGTLNPVSPITNPSGLTVSIDVWVLPTGYAWWDWVDKNQVTGGIDNIGRITTAVTAKVGSINIAQDGSDLSVRPSWNGEGSYHNRNSSMLQGGANSAFTRFHNGGQFTMYCVFKQLAVPTTYVGPIIESVNETSANRGIGIYVDNRSVYSRDNIVYFIIVNGTGPVFLITTSADAIVQDAWNVVKVTYDGTTVRIYTAANGGTLTQVGSGTQINAPSASDPNNPLHFGNFVTNGSQTGFRGYLKHVYMEDSNMSSGDQIVLDGWSAAMAQENINIDDANVYGKIGQSNQRGSGANVDIEPELSDRVGAYIMWPLPTPATSFPASGQIDSYSYWQELQLGVSQNFEDLATLHGMEMRFGYEMNLFNQNCYIVKYGIGGTPIYDTPVYNNWNATTPTIYSQWNALMATAFDELTHVFRKNPVYRGLDIFQGETDAILTASGSGAVFKSNWTTFINSHIDYMEGLGYTIDKLRIVFFRISDAGGYSYDATEYPAIRTATVDLGDNYLSDNPSYSGNIKGTTWITTDDVTYGDAQHVSTDGQNALGTYLFNYYKPYSQE